MASHNHKPAAFDSRGQLRLANLKVTKARVAILDLLSEHHGPFTAEELHTQLTSERKIASCDVVTVYRCLAKLEAVQLVTSCDFGDGSIRYELRTMEHHHHIICRKCKSVKPLPQCPIDDRTLKIPQMGFNNISHKLEFFGICPKCQMS